jgi:hypothetical protein
MKSTIVIPDRRMNKEAKVKEEGTFLTNIFLTLGKSLPPLDRNRRTEE